MSKKIKKPKKDDWAVISGGKQFQYALVCFKNEKDYFWGQGNSWSTLYGEQKIVEFFGKVNEDDWDDLEIKYLKKYYPAKKSDAIESAGWISPDGEFFVCSYSEHRGLAKQLSAFYYDNIENSELKLEEMNWIKVYADGILGYRIEKELSKFATKKQLKMIDELMLVNGSDNWNKNMKHLNWLLED